MADQSAVGARDQATTPPQDRHCLHRLSDAAGQSLLYTEERAKAIESDSLKDLWHGLSTMGTKSLLVAVIVVSTHTGRSYKIWHR